jgi:chitin disaccharide deacetylase
MMIINADDWGRSVEETDAALGCYDGQRITSVTAMVFMTDSKRAADIAKTKRIPTGLHLNFTQALSGCVSDQRLLRYHRQIRRFLNSSRYARLLYNPFLRKAFRYVFDAQVAEFVRLYGKAPRHFDGHQHMHLCANMMVALPIPAGRSVRRSFSFRIAEKNPVNRSYRRLVDRRLASRYRLADYFFDLSEYRSEERLAQVCRLAGHAKVEMMTHPVVASEREFLNSDRFARAMNTLSRGIYEAL